MGRNAFVVFCFYDITKFINLIFFGSGCVMSIQIIDNQAQQIHSERIIHQASKCILFLTDLPVLLFITISNFHLHSKKKKQR